VPIKSMLVVLLCLCISTPGWAATGPTDMQARFDGFDKVLRDAIQLPEDTRVPAITGRFDAIFDEYFVGPSLASVSDADLELLFRATDYAAYFPSGAKYTDLLLRVHEELLRRSQATSRHHAAVYGALIEMRRFSQARTLYRTYPAGLEPLPSLVAIPMDAPSVWRVNASGNRLTRQALDFGQADIVALVHPLCHFSRNALTAILSDPVLRAMFARHATLIVAPERGFRIDLVGEWNEQHPELPMAFMYARSDWPMFRAWGTPTFYFFRNGKLEQAVEGWPKEGRLDALIEAATRLGLLEAP